MIARWFSRCAVGIVLLTAGCGTFRAAPLLVPPVSAATMAHPSVAIAVRPFVDRRTNGVLDQAGVAQVGMFNNKAAIRVTTPLTEVVTTAVTDGLRSANFALVDARKADLLIGGSIIELWVHEYVTGYSLEHVIADVTLSIEVTDPSGARVGGFVVSTHLESEPSLDATEHDLPTLGAAIASLVSRLPADPRLTRILATRANGQPLPEVY